METPRTGASQAGMIPPEDGIAFRELVDRALDVVVVTDAALDRPGPFIRYVNPAFTRLTGWTADEVIGQSPRILQGSGTDRRTSRTIGMALRAGGGASAKLLNYTKSGVPYWADLRITPLRDRLGRVEAFAAFERDVTHETRRLDELEQLTTRDVLTGIPNRRALLRGAENAFEAFRPGRFCFAWVEVDRFDDLVGRLGQPAGDAVLMGVADLLAERVRRTDLVGRMGDKDFALCMPDLTLVEGAAVTERLRAMIAAAAFPTGAGPVRVTCSFGIAAAENGDDLAGVMARADACLQKSRYPIMLVNNL